METSKHGSDDDGEDFGKVENLKEGDAWNSHLTGSYHKRPVKGGPRDFEEVGHFLAALAVVDELTGVVGHVGVLVNGGYAGVAVFHPARSDQAASASSSLGIQSGPRAPQLAHTTCVACVPGSRKTRQLSLPQKGQGRGRTAGVGATAKVSRATAKLLSLLMFFMISACSPTPVITNGVVNDEAIQQIKLAVQKMRGLRFRQDIRVTVVTPATARALSADQILTTLGGESRLSMSLKVGMTLSGNTLRFQYANGETKPLDQDPRMFASMFSAAADPMVVKRSSVQISLVENGGQSLLRQIPTRLRLANALFHPLFFLMGVDRFSQRGLFNYELAFALDLALTDQAFSVSERLKAIRDNSDALSAFIAAPSGDAALVAGSLYRNLLPTDTPCDAVENPGRFLSWWSQFLDRGLPFGLRALPSLPPDLAYVCRIYQRGGWDSVNDIEEKPPISTQQIIDTAQNRKRSFIPVHIVIAGYEAIMAPWTNVFEDTFGELSAGTLLAGMNGETSPDLGVVSNWAGDRVIALQNGKSLSALWLIAFRDASSARTFSNLYRLRKAVSASDPSRVSAKGKVVFIATGMAAAQFDKLAPSVWSYSRFDGQPLSIQ